MICNEDNTKEKVFFKLLFICALVSEIILNFFVICASSYRGRVFLRSRMFNETKRARARQTLSTDCNLLQEIDLFFSFLVCFCGVIQKYKMFFIHGKDNRKPHFSRETLRRISQNSNQTELFKYVISCARGVHIASSN